jgi:hypothetical protein
VKGLRRINVFVVAICSFDRANCSVLKFVVSIFFHFP